MWKKVRKQECSTLADLPIVCFSVRKLTLSLIWVCMNGVRLLNWVWHGDIVTRDMGALLLLCLPITIAGLLLGDYLHRKVSEYHFRLGVYILLAISGGFMLVSNILKLIG